MKYVNFIREKERKNNAPEIINLFAMNYSFEFSFASCGSARALLLSLALYLTCDCLSIHFVAGVFLLFILDSKQIEFEISHWKLLLLSLHRSSWSMKIESAANQVKCFAFCNDFSTNSNNFSFHLKNKFSRFDVYLLFYLFVCTIYKFYFLVLKSLRVYCVCRSANKKSKE